MELLGDVSHVESRFVHLDTMLVLMQDRFMVRAKRTSLRNHFWMHTMVLLGDEAQVKAHFGPFGDSVNLNAR